MKKSTLVGRSDGPTTVINASLYGVIVEGIARPGEIDRAYGMINGIKGFLSSHVTDLFLLTHEDLSPLKQTPAAYPGSCRLKLPENLGTPIYSLLFEKFTAVNIGACFYIGENGSMDTVDKLSRYTGICRETIFFIGVPKTVDNDLPVTDHTPGYRSAVKHVASAVRETSLDASVCQQPAITTVELMGHHIGWVTAASALARKYPGDSPLLIYMPGVPFPMEQLFRGMERALSRQPSVVICISEGIRDKKDRFICRYTNDAQVDTFGYKISTGCVKILGSYVCSHFRVKVRSVEPNVNRRYGSLLASAADAEEAEHSGRRAAKKTSQGETGKMVACPRLSGPGCELEYGPTGVGNVCNHEKSFSVEWITAEGSDIRSEFLDYVLPLVRGQPDHIMGNGLPKYLHRR